MRAPHVLLTADEVREAVAHLMLSPYFVFDIETAGIHPRTNELLWIGLGTAGCVYLIPCGHPKGVQVKPEHKEKMRADLYYVGNDKRKYTDATQKMLETNPGLPEEQRRLSKRMIEYTVAATYEKPPKQLAPDVVMELLRPLMFSDRGKLGHNVKFDLESIAKYYDGEIPPPPYHDTILVRHTLVEDLDDYGLKTLTCDWFGVPWARRAAFYPNLGKSGIERYGLDEVARYLAKDVRYCWLMFERFFPLLERRGVQGVYDFEMTVYPVIMKMEQNGFPVDMTQVAVVKAELDRQIEEVEHKAGLLAGDRFSLSDLDAKRWVMFGEARKNAEGQPIAEYGKSRRKLKTQGLRVISRTKETSQPSMTQAVLDFWTERGNPMAELLLQWSSLEKLRGTFIGHPFDPTAKKKEDQEPSGLYRFAVRNKDGTKTVHTGYKQHGTVTGRLSATTPNLQQLPREMEGRASIRDLFVAAPGKLLIVADYDQVELRCAGYLANDPNMVEVFKEGQDIHRRAAAAMFDCDLEEVSGDMRQVGKTQNFAVLYGAGPNKIAAVAGCSIERAEEMIEGYFQEFQMLERWKARELQKARKRGDRKNHLHPPYVVIPPNNRLRRLPDLFVMDYDEYTGESIRWKRMRAERQAINAIVQGFASNITKLAMLKLDAELPSYTQMLAQVHDEIVFQVEEEWAEEQVETIAKLMGSITHPETGKSILGEIPLVASAAFGKSWAAAKKAAA